MQEPLKAATRFISAVSHRDLINLAPSLDSISSASSLWALSLRLAFFVARHSLGIEAAHALAVEAALRQPSERAMRFLLDRLDEKYLRSFLPVRVGCFGTRYRSLPAEIERLAGWLAARGYHSQALHLRLGLGDGEASELDPDDKPAAADAPAAAEAGPADRPRTLVITPLPAVGKVVAEMQREGDPVDIFRWRDPNGLLDVGQADVNRLRVLGANLIISPHAPLADAVAAAAAETATRLFDRLGPAIARHPLAAQVPDRHAIELFLADTLYRDAVDALACRQQVREGGYRRIVAFAAAEDDRLRYALEGAGEGVPVEVRAAEGLPGAAAATAPAGSRPERKPIGRFILPRADRTRPVSPGILAGLRPPAEGGAAQPVCLLISDLGDAFIDATIALWQTLRRDVSPVLVNVAAGNQTFYLARDRARYGSGSVLSRGAHGGFLNFGPKAYAAEAQQAAFAEALTAALADAAVDGAGEGEVAEAMRLAIGALRHPTFTARLFHLLALPTFVDEALQVLRPSLVVLCPQRSPFVWIAASLARQRGITTLAVEPHVVTRTYPRPVEFNADYVGVISDYFAEEYRASVGAGHVHVVGSPNYWRIGMAMADHDQAARVGQYLGLDDGQPTLLFVSQNLEPDPSFSLWRLFLDGLARSGRRHRVLLKLHRLEGRWRQAAYQRIAAAYGAAIDLVPTDRPTEELLPLVSGMVTFFSSAALESYIVGKPVLVLTPGGGTWPLHWPDQGIGIAARSEGEVAEWLSGLADPQGMTAAEWQQHERFRETHRHLVRGGDPARLLAVLRQVMAAKQDG